MALPVDWVFISTMGTLSLQLPGLFMAGPVGLALWPGRGLHCCLFSLWGRHGGSCMPWGGSMQFD